MELTTKKIQQFLSIHVVNNIYTIIYDEIENLKYKNKYTAVIDNCIFIQKNGIEVYFDNGIDTKKIFFQKYFFL